MQATKDSTRKATVLSIGDSTRGRPAAPGVTLGESPVVASRGVGRSLLRFPLFYKILVANAVIVVAVTAACGVAARATANGEAAKYMMLLGGGLLLSLASNAVIVRLALSPLKRLQRTAERVQGGDTAARVEPSELADRDLERLIATFNMMLDSGEVYRRRLRETAARAQNATEEERQRIARELHDGTAQTLAALRVQLRVARSVEDGQARRALLERVGAGLGEAAEEVRRIAQGLRPPALDMLGLAPALESFARATADTAGLALTAELSPVEGLLTPEAELALYRIVQEALSNVARHATAGTVYLKLEHGGDVVTATVEDDGRGFGVREEMSNGGLGLFGMQERAAYFGGTVEIDSQPGRGTRVRAIIPVLETAQYA
jgi:two-component system, NarL family, sensor histidine kinase UhpB